MSPPRAFTHILRLLRAHTERPRRRRAAEEDEEALVDRLLYCSMRHASGMVIVRT
jgi:hypothetical protein